MKLLTFDLAKIFGTIQFPDYKGPIGHNRAGTLGSHALSFGRLMLNQQLPVFLGILNITIKELPYLHNVLTVNFLLYIVG